MKTVGKEKPKIKVVKMDLQMGKKAKTEARVRRARINKATTGKMEKRDKRSLMAIQRPNAQLGITYTKHNNNCVKN